MTEMWERFTYYGMRAILILFMAGAVADGGLGLDDKTASAIYGLYIAGYLPARAAGRLDRRPADRPAARRVLGRRADHARQRLARHRRYAAVLHRPDRDRARRRPAQAEHQRHRRAALSRRRLAPRRRLLDLLHGHQPRRVPRLDPRADRRRGVRLERGLRAACDRHAVRPGAVPGHEKSPRRLPACVPLGKPASWWPVHRLHGRRRGDRGAGADPARSRSTRCDISVVANW